MSKKETPMVWGKDVKGIVLDRVVPGFGQKRFVLAEMTAEEVEFWESKGVCFGFYKPKNTKAEAPVQSKEERFNERVGKLLELGFERNENNFLRGEEKVNVSTVETMGVEKFDALLASFVVPTTEAGTEN